MHKDYTSNISPLGSKIFNISKVVFISALIFSLGGFFIAGTALATHTASVTVSPQYVKGGVPETYNFTVTNDGTDDIGWIYITVPSDFSNINSIQCPFNWASAYVNGQVQCAWGPGKDYLTSGNSAEVSFSATSLSGLTGDTPYTWAVDTYDNNGGSYKNTDAKTTVDVTPPKTNATGVPDDWVNSDVTVTLTCDDGTGSGCKETRYQICDENGDNCGNEQIGNSVSITCSDGSVCKHKIKYYSVDNVGNSEQTKTRTSGVIKIDKKAPITTASVGDPKYGTDPTYITPSTQITLNAEDNDSGVGTITYKVIDSNNNEVIPNTNYSEPFSLSDLSDGAYTISYWSEDKVGNVEEPNTLSVYVDDSGPTIGTINIEPSYSDGTNLYISGTSKISAPVNDEDGSGVKSCEYALNANDANPTWNPATYDPQKNLCKAENVDTSGATSINFRAIDNLGNSNEGNAVAVSPDTAGPTISNPSIDPSSPSNDNTPTITFGISDDKSGVKSESVQILDGSNTYTPTCSDGSCSYTFTSALDDGTYTFTISARDNVENSTSAKIENYVIDTKKPTTSDNAPTGWQKSDVTITLEPSDPTPSSGLAWTRYCIDTANECDPEKGTDYTGPVTISDEGITYFRYASKDKAGNVQDTVSREIKIDKSAPTVSVSGWDLGDSWTNATKTTSVSCENELSGCNEESYKLYISSSQITSCSTDSNQYNSQNDFQITSHSWVCAYAEDNAGNPGFSNSPVEFKVDQTPPTGELTGVPVDWQNEDAAIGLTSGDTGGSGVANVYLDVVSYGQTCTPSTSYSGGTITVSQHSTACWKVVDVAGNVTTSTAEIKVDEKDPNTTINSPNSGSWQNQDFEVSVSDSDTGGSGLNKCYYRVKAFDGSDWIYTVGDNDNWEVRNCSSTVTLTVGEGKDCPYQGEDVCRIQVKAVDKAGNDNWGPPYKSRTFSIDWTAPQTTLAVSPESPDTTGWYNSNTGAPTITLTCSDAVPDTDTVSGCDKIYYKWDDGNYTEYTSQITASEGTHTLSYFSKDKAGNSEATQTKQFEVDTQAPTVDAGEDKIANAEFTQNATVEDTNSGIASYSWEMVSGPDGGTITFGSPNSENTTISADKDGVYTIRLTVIDKADNTNYDEMQLTWDTQDPIINNFTTPVSDAVYKTGVPLQFTPDGTGSAVTCSYKIDDGSSVPVDCSSGEEASTTITDLSDGRHSLTLIVTDAVGNSVSLGVSFVVDLNNTLTVGPSESSADFTSIQKAIGEATEGDTIEVAAGTYDEQVVIDKSLTIQGQGDATIIKPSQATSNNFQLFSRKTGGSANTAAIVVANAEATIKNLKIDGSQISSVPSGATMFVGILYRGVNGTIGSVTVEKINIVNGNAIYLSSMGNEVEVEVKGCTISNFYKNGITSNYKGLTVNIHNNDITGSGLLDGVAQNGIQVGFGATGSVVKNTISDIAYTGEDYEATGILFIDSSGTAKDNTVTNCQAGIVAQAGWYPPVTCDVTIENNTIIDTSNLTGLSYIAGTGAVTWDENAIINVTIKNNSLTGPGYGEGVSIGSEYGEGIVNATIEGNDISNWGDGIWLGPTSNQIRITHNNIINNSEEDSGIHITGVDVSKININFNKIEGNATYGVYNGGTGMLNATNNWWGNVSGPYNEATNVGGTANAVSDNVDYRPWCSEESCSVEDNVAPYVVSHIPSTNAVGVNPLSNITVTFSEDVQCNAENGNWADCITLSPGVDNGSVSYNSDTYTLTFTPPESGLDSNQNYTVIISDVEDKSGNLLDGSVSWQFTTANHYSISIYTGWNLISIPTVPVDTSVEAVLGDAASAIDSVWTYDAASDTWYVAHPNNPEAPGNLTNMTAGYGYWVSAVDDAVISGYGNLFSEQQTPPQRTLVAGWNLIGYYQKAGIYSFGVNYALSTLADDYCDPKTKYWTSLVGYNNEGKNFVNINWNDEMNPGDGYWIFMKSSSIGTYMYGPGESEESCGK